MKILHTADWHLGKWLQGISLLDDQRHMLWELLATIDEEKPDVIVMAGDIYDRAIPPVEAIQLFGEWLQEVIEVRQIPFLAVTGNHDSPGRVHFGSAFMKSAGLHLVGDWVPRKHTVRLEDEAGPVDFHLIPYMDPAQVKFRLQQEESMSHQQAMERIVGTCLPLDENARHVFVGHAFVTPYGEPEDNTSEAERPLAIGGAEYVSAQLFHDFHYTALGHLHRAHHCGTDHVRFAGSPMTYAISEAGTDKGVLLIELAADGAVDVTFRALEPRRKMRRIEGNLQDLLRQEVSEDYVIIKLLDAGPVLSPMEQLRTVYPNTLHVERQLVAMDAMPSVALSERKQLSEKALFTAFLQELASEEPDEDTVTLFQEAWHHAEQESDN
ncbi:exonuclease SbcCD subunit D [Chryseomicrobium sp. FSL W7-1435]|uniref:exonuclease SbcCD subunit D n=1 Tax=Chryseomicrobium sp. FSL W7-1435 TaxID=2921704 RepID=UPI00315B39EE